MAELNPPQFLQNRTDHTAQGDRLGIAGLFARGGVRGSTDLVVAQQTVANMSVKVSLGHAYIPGTQDIHQGYYHVYNDADVTETIGAASSTQSRIDLVVARVQDAFYTGAVNAWDLFTVQGTPGSPGVRPAIPANSIELAQIAIGINATSITAANITRTAPIMSLKGGTIPVASQTERDAITTFPGLVVFRDDTNVLEFYDGAAWKGLTGGTPVVNVYTASATWTKPSGARSVHVRLVGGGGGSGGSDVTTSTQSAQAGGGGGGGYAESWIDASTLGATVAVTVGAGGIAGTNTPGAGAAGGTSSFGSVVVAGGGGGGATGVNSAAAAGIDRDGGSSGIPTAGQIQIPGESGGSGIVRGGLIYGTGAGGASQLASSRLVSLAGSAGVQGKQYGGGAAGSNNGNSGAAKAGAAGFAGVVIVETYF
jgi:hypothetical protein